MGTGKGSKMKRFHRAFILGEAHYGNNSFSRKQNGTAAHLLIILIIESGADGRQILQGLSTLYVEST